MILAEPGGDRRHALGRGGEDLAERALRAAGMRILDRRFRVRAGEIDLIALDRDVLVFVEVKTRSAGSLGPPAESVTRAKQRRLGTVALSYLARRGWLERPCRFDVVEVFAGADGSASIHHIPDAFRL